MTTRAQAAKILAELAKDSRIDIEESIKEIILRQRNKREVRIPLPSQQTQRNIVRYR